MSFNDLKLWEQQKNEFHTSLTGSSGHSFQNLQAFLRLPHISYRPLLILDPDHGYYANRKFLLGPFFNIAILGQTRKAVGHEITVQLEQLFDSLGSVNPEQPEIETHNFLKQLKYAGYASTDHIDAPIYEALAESVRIGVKGGIKIFPCDTRTPEDRTLAEESTSFDYQRREQDLSFNPGRLAFFRTAHRNTLGFEFPWHNEDLASVIWAIAMDDLDTRKYRFADADIAHHMVKKGGKTSALVIGADHGYGSLPHTIEELTGYNPAIIEINFRPYLKNMVRNIYRGNPPHPLYSAIDDQIIYYPELMPRIKPEKLALFKRIIMSEIDLQPNLPQSRNSTAGHSRLVPRR